MPLPVVVGVAWGRLRSSLHKDAEKWARVGFESSHAFVISCNKSAVTPPRRQDSLHNTSNKMPLPVVVGVAWGRSTSSFHEGAEKQSERVESGVGARCVHPVRAWLSGHRKNDRTSRREKQQRPQGKNRKCVNVLPHNHACPIKTQRPGTRHAQRTP